ncbi:MAG: hypothetical protein P8Z35_06145 [Ignavibacteriaceae bacterium]
MHQIKYIMLLLLFIFPACSTLILKPADFAWPIESVLKVDDNGYVKEQRFSFSFNAKDLFFRETGDSLGYRNKELHLIRDSKGFYFITANNFKNVYVFNADNGSLKLNNKIEISDTTGMKNPAFNQRTPYIELLYNNKSVNLTNEGIIEGDKK